MIKFDLPLCCITNKKRDYYKSFFMQSLCFDLSPSVFTVLRSPIMLLTIQRNMTNISSFFIQSFCFDLSPSVCTELLSVVDPDPQGSGTFAGSGSVTECFGSGSISENGCKLQQKSSKKGVIS
jgi:hypothetical protein